MILAYWAKAQTTYKINPAVKHYLGYSVAHLVEALCYKPEGRGFDSRWGHWDFSMTSFRPRYGPGVDLTSDRNEYQRYLLEVKVAGA